MSQPISVLLVDDETIILDCLSIYFDDEGFEVHTATTAAAALEMLPTLKPQVCITDMGLDDMNGIELINKAHVLSPATRFLLHSGAPVALTDELIAQGMTSDDVLVKPVYDFGVFAARIRALVPAGD